LLYIYREREALGEFVDGDVEDGTPAHERGR